MQWRHLLDSTRGGSHWTRRPLPRRRQSAPQPVCRPRHSYTETVGAKGRLLHSYTLPGRPGRSRGLSGEMGPLLHSCKSTRALPRRRCGATPPTAGPPRSLKGSVGGKGTSAPLVQIHPYTPPAVVRCSSAGSRAAQVTQGVCRGKRDLCSTRARSTRTHPRRPGTRPLLPSASGMLWRDARLASGLTDSRELGTSRDFAVSNPTPTRPWQGELSN